MLYLTACLLLYVQKPMPEDRQQHVCVIVDVDMCSLTASAVSDAGRGIVRLCAARAMHVLTLMSDTQYMYYLSQGHVSLCLAP